MSLKIKHFENLAIHTRCSRFQLSHLNHELNLEGFSHGLLKIEEFIYNLLEVTNKTHKSFRNKGDQIFNQIWLGDGFFQKSRQILIEKLNRGWDILNYWVKKLNNKLENYIIPWFSKPTTSTNWRNLIPTKTHPGIDPPVDVGRLA